MLHRRASLSAHYSNMSVSSNVRRELEYAEELAERKQRFARTLRKDASDRRAEVRTSSCPHPEQTAPPAIRHRSYGIAAGVCREL